MSADRVYELRGLFRDGLIDVLRDPILDGWRVRVFMLMPDRDTGEKVKITQEMLWPQADPPPIEFVEQCVHQLALHEAKEAFFVDGKRFNDPHAGRAST